MCVTALGGTCGELPLLALSGAHSPYMCLFHSLVLQMVVHPAELRRGPLQGARCARRQVDVAFLEPKALDKIVGRDTLL